MRNMVIYTIFRLSDCATGHVDRVGKYEMHTGFWLVNLL